MTTSQLPMPEHTLQVDFNEMVDDRTVLLSMHDYKTNLYGERILLEEGMRVSVCMEDMDSKGERDDLVASGVVIKNTRDDWSAHCKWCCAIDLDGVRARSELKRGE